MKKYRVFLMLLTFTFIFTIATSGCKQCSSDSSKAKDHPTEEKAKADTEKKVESKTDKDHPTEKK